MTSSLKPLEGSWDDRNNVEIRRYASMMEMSHEAEGAYEFVAPLENTGGTVNATGLYIPSDSASLIVTFHGSLQRSKYTLPRFEWRRSLADVNAGQLYLADSTLELSSGLALGWYIGSESFDLAVGLATLIERISIDGKYSNVILTGSSGGGFASLAISRRLPGSAAIAFSPQTRVGDYQVSAVNQFRRAAYPMAADYDEVEAKYRSRVDLRYLYSITDDVNYVRYIQNTRDLSHYEKHYSPFAEMAGVDPLVGGMSVNERMEFLPQRLQPGHEPPSRGRFRQHLLAGHESFFGHPLSLGQSLPS